MIYIDCGYYRGMAEQLLAIDDSFTKYGFEAYPKLKTPSWVSNKAVWVDDMGVRIKPHPPRDDSARIGDRGTKVPSIDFSAFVASLPNEPIICSMDIEGAEFPVLEKMLKDNTIDKIDFLDIEFHHRLVSEKTSDDSWDLINRIRDRGVIIRLKEFL